MVFVCYLPLKEANIHMSFISVVTLVNRKQSEKPQFFHKNIVLCQKVFDMYLLLGLFSLFIHNSHTFLKKMLLNCCTLENWPETSCLTAQGWIGYAGTYVPMFVHKLGLIKPRQT